MKILIICPHLSTGGQPSVALKRIEALIEKNHEVYLIEYRQIAWSFVVQRDKVKNILGDKFFSLGNVWGDGEEMRDKFPEIVEKINPDIVHMEEIPEKFIFGMREEHINWLYRTDRKYKIIETTHTSTFDVKQKKYFPDKFMFVSPYSAKEYSKLGIPYSVVEYPIEKLEKNKSLAIKTLNLNSDYFHILNVGLFTSDKNQGYVFEIAKKLKDYKIHFHFVGNLAENFSDYWKPLYDSKLDNCFIYGERVDVDNFYQASDLLIHPSILELNPLAIKEATSYELPIFLNKLNTYLDMYDSYKNIKYLTMDIEKDSQMILDNFNIKKRDDNYLFKDSLIQEYKSVLNSDITPDADDYLEYDINFIDGARVEIFGRTKLKFDIEIIDKKTNDIIYQTQLGTGTWCATNIKYYKEYKINIKNDNKLLVTHDFDLKDRKVLISIDSKSIGDTLGWVPYVEEFRKKHDCKVYCSTFWNNFFIEQYPNITFLNPGSEVSEIYARYMIGWYVPVDFNKNPNDYKKQPMQKTASDILGLEYKEIKPKIKTPEGARPIKEKYVCIAQFSTANTKHWHYPCKDNNKGWQILVDWLIAQGYKVMVISKQKTNLKNIIDKTGDFPIEHRINELKYCEFFIGVGSGLSWLAWAIGKNVVMISGFSNPICEFQSNNINVHNFNVCNGCFNRHVFDRGDWNWCPEHKNTDRQFECSINITPEMVINRIVNSKLIENTQPFDLDKYDVDIILNPNDIKVYYDRTENKISIAYSNQQDTLPLNVDFKDTNNKIYHTLSQFSLSSKYIVWCAPKEKIDTNKLIATFYEKSKILDIEIEI
jgi:autotransporter strand-loop-strand O-heptosyltransferase